jgi:hypothetical protein
MKALSGPGLKCEIGDLVLYLDADGAFLRAVALRGEELFRGIGFVVRDRNWGTYRLEAEPQVEQTADRITIATRGHIAGVDGALDWRLDWTITPQGLTGRMQCESANGFPTARAGFVVLHAVAGCRGKPVTMTHADGSTEDSVFPVSVSPQQPFLDIAAMDYATEAGHRLRLRFEGEIFETEDQRNWTDASYKTYSRPLSKPFPYRIGPDAPDKQVVTLEILSLGSPIDTVESPPVVPHETIMPPLGVGISPGSAAAGLTQAIETLAPAFTAVEIDLARGGAIAETQAILATVPGAVRLDLRAAPCAIVLEALRALAPALAVRDLVGVSLWDAEADLVAAAREILPCVAIGSGTGAFFTELNRGTNWPETADYLSWTGNPTVHGWTDDTLGESVEPLADILATASAKWPLARFQIGPMTLGMRFNPNATSPEARGRPAPADPRQGDSIAGAWMLGVLAGYADDRVETLSFFEARGPWGMIDEAGRMTPAGALFRKLAAHRDAPLAILSWPGEPRLRGLRIGAGIYALANLHHETRDVPLPDGTRVTIPGYGTLWIDGTG